MGVEFGSSAKLLWQWSPFRTGEGIDASDATNFWFPAAAGLRLEAGRPYSFVVQVDYDMGYFFGQQGGGAGQIEQGLGSSNIGGAGQIEWQQWQPWDRSGIHMHETTGLRPYDAATLSLTQLDFALGSAVRLPATTDRGTTAQLPPLVKTEALWSLDEASGVLAPGASATILAFGGKTRALGTAVELAVWRPTGLASRSTYGRAAKWEQAMYEPWEEVPHKPRFDSPPSMTGSGVFIATGDVLRLACEFSVRRSSVAGGYGVLDEICAATLIVYPATALRETALVREKDVDHGSVLPGTVGDAWLTQHTMSYDAPLDTTPVASTGR